MANLQKHILFSCLISTVFLGACGNSEPDIPTFDPMDKVQPREGWKVGRAIAVSPGKDKPKAHHVQTIASGLHQIDFGTPPKSYIPVTPSCSVKKPSVNSGKYLILGDGNAQFPLMKKNIEPTTLVTFNNKKANALARTQARQMLETGRRKKPLASNIAIPASSMTVKDVFITETSESVAVALAGGGLYNFHLAPGVRLTGVVVYTGETGYNKSVQAAVAGVPDGVPVNFVSEEHKATKNCWTRIQTRTDKSWSKNLNTSGRFKAVQPHWKKFYRRVRNDFGDIPEKNVISVRQADHFLIGPRPVRYEDRIPYVAFNGKSVHYSEADYINFGTREQNRAYVRQILDQLYESHLNSSSK